MNKWLNYGLLSFFCLMMFSVSVLGSVFSIPLGNIGGCQDVAGGWAQRLNINDGNINWAQDLYNASETNYLSGITFRMNITYSSISQTLFKVRIYEGGTGDSGTLLQTKIFTFADVSPNTTQWLNVELNPAIKWDSTKHYWVIFSAHDLFTTGDQWGICEDNCVAPYNCTYFTDDNFYYKTGAGNWFWHSNGLLQMFLNMSTSGATGTSVTNVTYAILPITGSYSQEYTFYINITGGIPVYTINGTMDGRPLFFNWHAGSNYTTITGSGFGIGNHTSQISVKDSYHNNIVYSNYATFETTSIGQIAPVTLTINPLNGTAFSTFNFQTTDIYNGTEGYTVNIRYFYFGQYYSLATCSNLIEHSECNGTFSARDFPSDLSGYIPITALITDYVGNTAQSNAVQIHVYKPTGMQNLSVNFNAYFVNMTTDDFINLTLAIYGGHAPYKVIFEDWFLSPAQSMSKPLCTYENSDKMEYILYLKPSYGEHRYGVWVWSADGQQTYSYGFYSNVGVGTDKIWEYSNRITNCVNSGGVLGEGSSIYTGKNATEKGGETALNDNDLCFANNCVKTSIIAIIIIVGLGVYAEYKAKSGGVIFVGILIIGLIFLAYIHIIPAWIPIIGGVLLALVFAYLGRKALKGG